VKEQVRRIREFENAFNINPDSQDYQLKHKILMEELDEYLIANNHNDEVEIADAIVDILYIAFGLVTKHGLDDVIEDLFAEVHASNMSKLGEDGNPIIRNDGKILKGPNYFKPDISKYLK
jgi:predicted HAD superfamily Cof-like phosphohydrolase